MKHFFSALYYFKLSSIDFVQCFVIDDLIEINIYYAHKNSIIQLVANALSKPVMKYSIEQYNALES